MHHRRAVPDIRSAVVDEGFFFLSLCDNRFPVLCERARKPQACKNVNRVKNKFLKPRNRHGFLPCPVCSTARAPSFASLSRPGCFRGRGGARTGEFSEHSTLHETRSSRVVVIKRTTGDFSRR